MKLRLTTTFDKDYIRLPDKVKHRVNKQLELLIKDPSHPSLKKHKVKSSKGLWEIWVTANYRVVFSVESDTYVVLQVGTHRIIDRK